MTSRLTMPRIYTYLLICYKIYNTVVVYNELRLQKQSGDRQRKWGSDLNTEKTKSHTNKALSLG